MCQSKAQGGRRCNGQRKGRNAAKVHQTLSNLLTGGSRDSALEELRALSASFSSLTPAQHWTLWQSIISSDTPSHAIRALFETGLSEHYPELHAIKDVPQDASWHPEGGVAEHAAQAADVAAQNATRDGLNERDRQVAVLAAMCHDLGKATHTQVHSDGRITSRGHDVAGEAPAKRFLARIGADEDMQGKVGVLVRTHMRHINEPSVRSAARLKSVLAEHGLTLADWARVADADCGGRGEASQHGVGERWLAFA